MNAAVPKIVLFIAVVACLAGCKSHSIYAWGSYEEGIYDMYVNPGKAEPGVQIASLKEDIEKAGGEGQRVPPGVHAHLGYLYYTQGNLSDALAEFATERELFPESAPFIDGMVARLKKNRRR